MNCKQLSILILLSISIFSCKKDESETNNINKEEITNVEDLRINQIQVIASHNSYRLKTTQAIFDFVLGLINILPASLNPEGWDYTHPPIEQQFDNYPVRGLELDIYYDPAGGNFYNREGNSLVGLPTASNLPELQQPGFKIIHIPDLDYNTNYLTFKQSLQAVKNWSDAHPNHVPIFINIEYKEDAPASAIPGNYADEVPIDANSVSDFENEIKSVFGVGLEQVFSPDELRGTYSSLKAAVEANNWPKLKDARGKIIFIMEGGLVEKYVENNPSLNGRVAFVYADNDSTETAAFIMRNSAVRDEAEIKSFVQKGYIVRTRSDSDTDEARTGDYSAMNAAFRSGAQITHTDYYKPDERAGQPGWTDFQVKFPNNELVRINPVSAEKYIQLGTITE